MRLLQGDFQDGDAIVAGVSGDQIVFHKLAIAA
jgi:hypothetical protein